MEPLVIIGTGLAGYRLAKAFRQYDRTRELHLVTQDDGSYYSKPALSTGLRQQKSASDLVMATAEHMQAELDARIHVHTTVSAIDLASKALRFSSGSSLGYGQLVLACGASPVPLPCANKDAPPVLFVNDLADYRVFRQHLAKPQKVLVIGAGLVGCELANDLLCAGHQVHVCALSSYPLDQLLVPQAGQVLQKNSAMQVYISHWGSPLPASITKMINGLCKRIKVKP